MAKRKQKRLQMLVEVSCPDWLNPVDARREVRTLVNERRFYDVTSQAGSARWEKVGPNNFHAISVRAVPVQAKPAKKPKKKETPVVIEGLSERQQQVLELAAAGMTAKETGEILGLSSRTVEIHRYNAMRKVGAPNLTQAAFRYQQAKHAKAMDDLVLIWSEYHQSYWKPNRNGYTARVSRAGIYTREEAMRLTAHCVQEQGIELEPVSGFIANADASIPAEVVNG